VVKSHLKASFHSQACFSQHQHFRSKEMLTPVCTTTSIYRTALHQH